LKLRLNQAVIIVYGEHVGHNPFDVGCVRHVAKMSFRIEHFHKFKASPVRHACYRFFMIPKEVHNIASKLNLKNALSDDDWATSMQDVYARLLQEKVVHVQPYIPSPTGSFLMQPFYIGDSISMDATHV
jgi:hypothetical protein